MAPYQPLSSTQYLQNVQANAKPLPTNKAVPGILNSLAPKAPATSTPSQNTGGMSYANMTPVNATPASIGIKTKSPTDTIKPTVNTTSQPQVVKPVSGGKTTDGGTENTNQYNPNVAINTNTGNASAGVSTQNNTGLYGQLVTDLANRSKQSGQDYQDAQAEAKRVSDEQTALAQDYAHKTNNIAGTAGFLTQQNGEQGLLNNQYNTVQNALSSQYSGATNRLGAANTQQGLLQSALTSATGAAAPTGNIINVDPITGLPVAGGSLGQLADTAGKVQGIQSGAAALAAAGGQTEAQNKIALGTASTGANAKSVGDYTNQNNTISNSTAKLDNIALGNNSSGGLIANMGTTDFNPYSSPVGNMAYSQYFTEKNPAAKAGILAGLGEIKNQISNVVASSTGLTPTGVTNIADSYDLSALSPSQLNDFLLYIKSYAQNNIAANQKTIDRIGSGGSVDTTQGPLPVPKANSTGQATAGTGATLAAGFLGKVISEVGNAVSGATAGAAASILQ